MKAPQIETVMIIIQAVVRYPPGIIPEGIVKYKNSRTMKYINNSPHEKKTKYGSMA